MARLCTRYLDNTFTVICDTRDFIRSVPICEISTFVENRTVTMPLSKPLTFEMLQAALEKAMGLPAKCDVRSDSVFLEQAMELIYD